uniref:Uncharacterized protein n=1 Tax=Plectus sambesii TaxID=2011161 RepID=A0A914XID6_9BILA
MVRNRSEKDKERVETVESMLQRVKEVQMELVRMLEGAADYKDGALSPTLEEVASIWSSSRVGGTLSVLSDDSFMSALEDMPPQFDDLDVLMREPLNLDPNMLLLYKKGLKEAEKGNVAYRKSRADFCSCESEDDFAAKLWCIRQAFRVILANEHNRQWLVQHGRQMIADLMRHGKKDPSAFFTAYDQMVRYLSDPSSLEDAAEELKHRRVAELSFWDVVLDFILIDAFEDVSHPPSAVLAVSKNRFLSDSIKQSTLSTVIWSMLKAKRQRLLVKDGFIAHFYDISEHVSPAITWGLLGTNEQLRELCYYFKDQIYTFVLDVFDVQRVRYTSTPELAEDVWQEMPSVAMTSKEDAELMERLRANDAFLRSAINLIPIDNWGFDEKIRDRLKQRKHRLVNEKLTQPQKARLSKAVKQRLSKADPNVCRTVTEVWDWMASTKLTDNAPKPQFK